MGGRAPGTLAASLAAIGFLSSWVSQPRRASASWRSKRDGPALYSDSSAPTSSVRATSGIT
eukprot:scaffold60548_cov47-Prasinocladus_malaysianus.AAC.1